MGLFRRKSAEAGAVASQHKSLAPGSASDFAARRSDLQAERTRIRASAKDGGDPSAAADAALALLAEVQALNDEDPKTCAVPPNPSHAPSLDYYRDAASLLRKAERYDEEVALIEAMLSHPGIMYGHEKWGEERLPRATALRDAT